MAEQKWYERYAEGIVIGILACIAWGFLIILMQQHHRLAVPLLFGGAAAGVYVSGAA